jgi:hypothetical protein
MSEIIELGMSLIPKVAPIWLILWKSIGIELKIIKHQTTKLVSHTDKLLQSIEILTNFYMTIFEISPKISDAS